ncbi:MAG: hypothetical protein ABFC96_08485 [Thermoguttaceae bacterium]
MKQQGIITMRASRIFDSLKEGKEPAAAGMLLTDSDEYKEGETASRRGATTRDNPYPFLSPEYWRWQEGLLGNCSKRTAGSRSMPFESSGRRNERLGGNKEAVVAIVDHDEYVEADAVLAAAS